jgi:hypothetical protein
MSKRQALQAHAEATGQELRAVELQYKRGKSVFPKLAKKSSDTRS